MDFKVVNAVVPVTKETFQSVMAKPDQLFDMMQLDFRQIAETTLSAMLQHELTAFLGREAYVRTTDSPKNHRNGSYQRSFSVKNLGELKIQVPRDRNGEYQTEMLQKYERYDQELKRDICMMFLSGCSTRGIELMSETLIGRRMGRRIPALHQKGGEENYLVMLDYYTTFCICILNVTPTLFIRLPYACETNNLRQITERITCFCSIISAAIAPFES